MQKENLIKEKTFNFADIQSIVNILTSIVKTLQVKLRPKL